MKITREPLLLLGAAVLAATAGAVPAAGPTPAPTELLRQTWGGFLSGAGDCYQPEEQEDYACTDCQQIAELGGTIKCDPKTYHECVKYTGNPSKACGSSEKDCTGKYRLYKDTDLLCKYSSEIGGSCSFRTYQDAKEKDPKVITDCRTVVVGNPL